MPRSVRTFDPAKLALKTEIDDFSNVFGFDFFSIDLGIFLIRTVSVDGVEKFWKAAAVSHTQSAISAETKDPFNLRTQVFGIVITRVGRVVSRIVNHRYTPLADHNKYFSRSKPWV
jgi:hypothetical protein